MTDLLMGNEKGQALRAPGSVQKHAGYLGHNRNLVIYHMVPPPAVKAELLKKPPTTRVSARSKWHKVFWGELVDSASHF